MKPIRVLTFLHSFEPGGVERVALRLHREWCRLERDSRLVLGREEGALSTEARDLTYAVLPPAPIPTARWETLFMILTLPRVVRRERPDVLFCAGNTYAVVALALKLILGRGCPPIVAKISNDLVRRDFHPVIRWSYHRWLRLQPRFIDRFVGIAEPMRAEIETMMRVSAERVTVVNDPAIAAVDLPDLRPGDSVTRDNRRFVGVGRLSPQKNFALAITAFARIATPDDRLTLYGEGSEQTRLMKLAAELNIADQVTFAGFVSNLPKRLDEADVFVLSSDYEGVPAVVIDALAAGIAIVATDCSVSMRDLLDDGRLGQLVPVGDAEALASAMERATVAPPPRAAMRAQAMRFTIETAAPAWWRVFAETVPDVAEGIASHA